MTFERLFRRDAIPLVLERALWFRGESHQPDAVIVCRAGEAVELLDSGRARLEDPRDRPLVRAAAIEARDAALRTIARVGRFGP